jgi:DHA2 family multidrug resistance protein
MTSTTDDRSVSTQDAPIGVLRRWAITATVMMVTIMQVLDVTVTNVALPHMQGSLSPASMKCRGC